MAYQSLDVSPRESEVISVLRKGDFTSREVAYNLGKEDMNYARPRLTDLFKKEIVKEVGKKVCQWTGKTVAVYGLR